MKKIFALFLITAFAALAANASISDDNKNVLGKWKYEVASAPYGYEKGTINISEKENELEGEVQFADGYKIELKNLTFKEEILKFGLYIDYEYISVEATVKNEKMKGTVKTPDGPIALTAEKAQ